MHAMVTFLLFWLCRQQQFAYHAQKEAFVRPKLFCIIEQKSDCKICEFFDSDDDSQNVFLQRLPALHWVVVVHNLSIAWFICTSSL